MERVFREQSSPKKHVPKNRHRAENAQNIDWNSKTQLVFSEISPRCRFFGTRFWCDFDASFERFLTGVGHLDRRASGAHFADGRTDGQTDRQTHIDPHFGGLKRAVSPGIITFDGPYNSPQPFDCIFGSGTHSFCCPLGFGHSKNIWCSPKQHPALWES